jgi:cysteinyl-tRNA synthetase
MIRLIGRLIERGNAYVAEGHVLFDVPSMPDYGRLSNRTLDEMVAGARVDVAPYKRDPMDFVLWKPSKPGEPAWPSPWSSGRPGWHIECSAMAGALLGDVFDIHGGGIDLVFPHHENEIAQSEGAHGGEMAHIWMHNEMLELGDEKMSKSLGNIAPLADVLDRWPAEVVIAYFLTSHYRSRLPFSEERMDDATAVVERLSNALRALDRAVAAAGDGHDPDLSRTVVEGRTQFFAALDDDFTTPAAFAALFEMVRGTNRAVAAGLAGAGQLREARRELVELLDVLGLGGIDRGPATAVPDEVSELLERRQEARAARDFAGADALRDRIRALGWAVIDTPEGPRVEPA